MCIFSINLCVRFFSALYVGFYRHGKEHGLGSGLVKGAGGQTFCLCENGKLVSQYDNGDLICGKKISVFEGKPNSEILERFPELRITLKRFPDEKKIEKTMLNSLLKTLNVKPSERPVIDKSPEMRAVRTLNENKSRGEHQASSKKRADDGAAGLARTKTEALDATSTARTKKESRATSNARGKQGEDTEMRYDDLSTCPLVNRDYCDFLYYRQQVQVIYNVTFKNSLF